MADITDVELALATLLANAIYPTGTSGASAIGAPAVIIPCWPTQDDIRDATAHGKVIVSIWAMNNAGRETTRFFAEWLVEPPGPATVALTVAISGTTATFGGSIIPGQYVSMIVNSGTYTYVVQTGGTPASLATGLATLISLDTPASSAGPALSVPTAHKMVVRVGGVATMAKEIRRRVHRFMITVWAPTRVLRTTAAKFIDQLFADTVFINLPDATCGWVTYAGTGQTDATAKESIWRRDLFLNVDFPNVDVDAAWQVTLPVTNVGPYLADGTTPITSVSITS